MKRRFIFLNGDEEIILPITPERVSIEKGISIDTVNIVGIGDIRMAGRRTLADISFESFFPAKRYSFASPKNTNAYAYVDKFNSIVSKRKPVRFIVSGTDINIRVLIKSFTHGEGPGGNDVEYTMKLSEYRSI